MENWSEWFPRTKKDLDKCSRKILELKDDHPVFKDQDYRKRREHFAYLANKYEHGQPIPRVKYTQEEVQIWGEVFNKLTKQHLTHACKEYNDIFPQLAEECGYRADNIPQLEDISRFLQARTDFQLRPVAGLLSPRNFLAGFAFRVYHCTQYVRHTPSYNPEPDVCHELLGHVPMLSDPSFANVAHEIGLASLGAPDEYIDQLSTVFWFTFEYGICKQDGEQKAYGAGLLSSFGELKYCLGGDDEKPEVRPLNVFEAAKQGYPITRYQPIYYLAESYTDAINQAREFAKTVPHPFTIHYDRNTQSVMVIDTKEGVQEMASDIKHNIGIREELHQSSLHDAGATEQTSVLYKGIARHFSWKNFGFKLFLPSNALPSGVAECLITIKATGEGQFKFPDDTEPVSGIYSISSQCTLQKPAVVEIEHCAVVKTIEQCSRLRFVVARSTGLQQVFHSFSVEDGGDFSPNNPYGRIEITQFSWWSIVCYPLPGLSVPRLYSASLYYIPDGIDKWKVHFVITWDLTDHNQGIKDHFRRDADAYQPVEFDAEGKISLAIPEDGINSNGWTITPLSPPVVRKERVDRYRHGGQIPSCQILVKWADSERRAVESIYKVTLQGTNEPTFFNIECKPTTTSILPQSTATGTNRIIPVLESEPELREFENEIISKISAKWRAVGIQLGLTLNKLDQISTEESNDCQNCFRRVFREWKSQNCERSWSVILRILQTDAVGEGRLAEDIRQRLQNNGE